MKRFFLAIICLIILACVVSIFSCKKKDSTPVASRIRIELFADSTVYWGIKHNDSLYAVKYIFSANKFGLYLDCFTGDRITVLHHEKNRNYNVNFYNDSILLASYSGNYYDYTYHVK